LTSLFLPLKDETRLLLDRLPSIIDKTFPLPGRYRSSLPRDVAELSLLLTSGREKRGASYLGKPGLLSAYLRYFLPWNIYRLCRLLSGLPLNLKPNDAINDLGAGPLTFAASLWLSRPEFRKIPLEFRCLDRTAAVLDAGKDFFAALVSETTKGCPWLIKTIRGELKRGGSLSVELRGKPAALSAAVNVYNELFWSFSPLDREGLERFTYKQARLLSSLTENRGSVLVVEPGIPRSGEFISLLRAGLIKEERPLLSPCTGDSACALPGTHTKSGVKAKWCHFAFDTEDAPSELHKLSTAAKIPKERAVLSFILAGPVLQKAEKKDLPSNTGRPVKVRIISDPFPVSSPQIKNQYLCGRYGCSEKGLLLVTGSSETVESSPSGSLEEVLLISGEVDGKSGALLAEIKV